MRIIDVSDDLGASFKAFAETLGAQNLPETVKTAAWVEPASAKDRDFALILVDSDGTAHRKYACHDPGNILVSMFYLDQAQPHLNPAAVKTAAVNLSSLAKDWGLDVPAEIEKLATLVLPEGAERDVIDARRVHYHPPVQRLQVKTASGPFAKLASAKLAWHDMTPQERRTTVLELKKEAESVPLVMPEHFYRYAGDGVSEKFAMHMRMRESLTSDPEVVAEYRSLAKTASLFPPENVVEAVYLLDEAAHLRWHGGDRYGESLPDPVRCVYDTQKEASFTWNSGGDFCTEHDLEMFRHRSNARKLFTDTFTDALWLRYEKDPVALFKSMPDEQKHLLSRLAHSE